MNTADIFSIRNNYIKTREIFNQSILKVKKNRLLFTNKYKLDVIIYIL